MDSFRSNTTGGSCFRSMLGVDCGRVRWGVLRLRGGVLVVRDLERFGDRGGVCSNVDRKLVVRVGLAPPPTPVPMVLVKVVRLCWEDR